MNEPLIIDTNELFDYLSWVLGIRHYPRIPILSRAPAHPLSKPHRKSKLLWKLFLQHISCPMLAFKPRMLRFRPEHRWQSDLGTNMENKKTLIFCPKRPTNSQTGVPIITPNQAKLTPEPLGFVSRAPKCPWIVQWSPSVPQWRHQFYQMTSLNAEEGKFKSEVTAMRKNMKRTCRRQRAPTHFSRKNTWPKHPRTNKPTKRAQRQRA